MSASEPQPESPSPVRKLADVPVFNCHVYLCPPDASGIIKARAATLPEITAEGTSERDVLRSVVHRFKAVVGGYMQRGEPIPWLNEPLPAAAGEIQRFVPVHF